LERRGISARFQEQFKVRRCVPWFERWVDLLIFSRFQRADLSEQEFKALNDYIEAQLTSEDFENLATAWTALLEY
jgi:hypothetical protein